VPEGTIDGHSRIDGTIRIERMMAHGITSFGIPRRLMV
jgi:hypothetical protein